MRGQHQVVNRGGVVGGQVVDDLLAADVMGGDQLGASQFHRAVFDHHQVTVADPGIKMELLIAHFEIELLNNFPGFSRADMAGAEVVHVAPAFKMEDVDQVAAESHVIGAQVDAHAGGFQRCAAGVVAGRIVAKNRQVGHVAAGGKAGRNRNQSALLSGFRQFVEVGGVGGRQRRPALQAFLGFIGHAVAEDDQVLFIVHGVVSSGARFFTIVIEFPCSLKVNWSK